MFSIDDWVDILLKYCEVKILMSLYMDESFTIRFITCFEKIDREFHADFKMIIIDVQSKHHNIYQLCHAFMQYFLQYLTEGMYLIGICVPVYIIL